MPKKRVRGLSRELDVLVLVEDLDRDAQKLCAKLLRSIVRTAEERATMKPEECRIVRSMRSERGAGPSTGGRASRKAQIFSPGS